MRVHLGFLCLIACVVGDVATQCESELQSSRLKVDECVKAKESELLAKNQLLQQKEALLSTRTAEVTVKQQELDKLMGEITQYKKVLGEWQQRSQEQEQKINVLSVASEKSSEFEKQLTQAQQNAAQLSAKVNESSQRLAEATSRLAEMETRLAETETRLTAEQGKLTNELRAKDEQSRVITVANSQLKAQVAQLTAQVDAYQAQVDSFKAEMSKQSELIYSSSQFWKTFEDSRKIVRAFSVLMHRRLVRLVGPNTYELAKLQVSMLGRRTQQQAVALYTPVRAKAIALYDEKLKESVAPVLEKAKENGTRMLAQAQEHGRKALVVADHRMERFIRNLASVDPSVSDLFPQDFHERCYAFAFVSLLVYGATHVIAWLWTTFVATPLGFVFGRGGKRKNRRGSKRPAAKTKKLEEEEPSEIASTKASSKKARK